VLLASAASAGPPLVRFENGRIWLVARGVAAPDLFSAVAEKTGVRFVVDADLKPGAITVDIEGQDLERAVRALVGAVPEAAGHTMSYARDGSGTTRLTAVTIYGAGKAPAGATAAVYEAANPPAAEAPMPFPTPDLGERMQRMIEAGVPRETAEKVIKLTEEVQKLQATPVPGSYRPDDLSATSREQLQPLIDRGVPMERAVQMLLLQERYQETLRELSSVPGGLNVPGVAVPSPPSPEP
jgi:hypothetical protein